MTSVTTAPLVSLSTPSARADVGVTVGMRTPTLVSLSSEDMKPPTRLHNRAAGHPDAADHA
jgi:hypothetical protein